MDRLLRNALTAWALALASASIAQTSYEQIQVGTVFRGDIGLGAFQKSLPMPPGEWRVIAKRSEVQPLMQGVIPKSTPRVTLVLKSLSRENPIVFLVVAFVPFPQLVTWSNSACVGANPAVLVEDFGTTSGSVMYLCAKATALRGFKRVVETASGNSNAWIRDNLPELAPYAREIPDDILLISVQGNRDRGRSVGYEFFVEREYDIQSHVGYAAHVKEWMSAAGTALRQFLEDKDASLKDFRKFASTPPQNSAVVSASAVPPAPLGQVMPPTWQVGDEWRYSYQSPSGSGTFVWRVDRIESVDGIPHDVIKSGTREIFYRVTDFAYTLERVDGIVTVRNGPSQLRYVWPLAIGKAWEQVFLRERPDEHKIENRERRCLVEGEETITVPAGTFRTLKIVWRNRNTDALVYEMWYAPDVKQWIKDRDVLSNGIRERELIAFRLK